MANYPPPYPPPGQPPFVSPPSVPPPGGDWRYQRRVLKDQARMQRDMLRAQRDAYRLQLRGLRRGSLVGPLLVIFLGVVFLLVQTGHLSHPQLWDWYSRWWPLLLIFVGVLLVAEWAFDLVLHRRDPAGIPYPRRTLGGVTFLVLPLVLLGIILSGVNGARHGAYGHLFNQEDLDQFLGDKHESEAVTTIPFAANGTLTIDNPRGDVTITGASDDHQIHVTAHKEVYSRSDRDADSRSAQLTPRLSSTANSTTVTVPALDGAHADLSVTVPAALNLIVNANHGDVRVNSLTGPIVITANHGDVEVGTIDGKVNLHVNNGGSSVSAHNVTGALTVEGHANDLTIADIGGPLQLTGEFFGTTHLERIRQAVKFRTSRTAFELARLDGEVEISPNADLSADQAAGPVVINTRNRNIKLDRISGDLSVTNRNGSVDLTSAPPLGNVTVENRNGSVDITVPKDAGFSVQAQTTNGNLENDFSFATEDTKDTNNRKSFAGTVGAGGALIRINASQGDISLHKASIAPLAPLPPMPLHPPEPPDPHPSTGLSREDREEIRRVTRQAAQDAKEAARESAAEIKDSKEQIREATREQVRQTVREQVQQAAREARQAAEEARRAARDAAQSADRDN